MQNRIRQTLDSISKDHDIRIPYTCESGNWGIASRDSDWDVRFLYLRKPGWYRSIDLEHKPDVIKFPIVDGLVSKKMVGLELDWGPVPQSSVIIWKPNWTGWNVRVLKSECSGVL